MIVTAEEYAASAQTQVLCPELYSLLQQTLGEVKIANEGMAYVEQNGTTVQFGEAYRVNCPFCGDNRNRLWLTHVYGQMLPGTPFRDINHGVCFNEGCLKNPEKRRRLADMLFGLKNKGYRHFEIRPGKVEPRQLSTVPSPGDVVPVTQLPTAHPAVQYLMGERRCSRELLDHFGVGYCVAADQRFPEFQPATNRIIIPIWMYGAFVGWQGRYIGRPPHKCPKYFTCPRMPKRLVLYNFEQARQWPFVVVVEGTTDVWSMRHCSVAVLGKTISPQQMALLQQTWAGKPILMMFDPEAYDEMADIVQKLAEFHRGPVVRIRLPDNTDPGTFVDNPGTLMNIVYAQAAERGVLLPR